MMLNINVVNDMVVDTRLVDNTYSSVAVALLRWKRKTKVMSAVVK